LVISNTKVEGADGVEKLRGTVAAMLDGGKAG
jgi:hypothetical protein